MLIALRKIDTIFSKKRLPIISNPNPIDTFAYLEVKKKKHSTNCPVAKYLNLNFCNWSPLPRTKLLRRRPQLASIRISFLMPNS